MATSPGIFNDVIGPVMRGPSSSHTAASWRISRICLDLLQEPLKKSIVDFDKDGAWAPNYREQGTTLGIDGGLLGLEMTDDRMKNTEQVALERGISIAYEVNSFKTTHVNTVRLHLEGVHGKVVQVTAVSLGGGSFELREIDGFEVKISGGYFELLVYSESSFEIPEHLQDTFLKCKSKVVSVLEGISLTNYKFSKTVPSEVLEKLRLNPFVNKVILVNPVLPIILGNEQEVPFTSIKSLLDYSGNEGLDLAAIGLMYEQCQSGLSAVAVSDKMKDLVTIINNSIQGGLAGTSYEDRILPQQSHLIKEASTKGRIPKDTIVNHIIENVSAIMESKSAMEVVVANPTAGSCGAVGGVLKAVADDIHANEDALIQAYFAAGIVGVYFAQGPGFSAEEHGCQVECGASAGMAAAGIVQLYGGTAKQAIDAASMAIQNMIGLVCDPIADRVEAPCLGKNVSAAVNALSSATMVSAGFSALIPLDEVIGTVSSVSSQMPTCVKCTGKGGLAITKTACAIKESLKIKSTLINN